MFRCVVILLRARGLDGGWAAELPAGEAMAPDGAGVAGEDFLSGAAVPGSRAPEPAVRRRY